MLRKITTFSLIALSVQFCTAQSTFSTDVAKNSIYGELAGTAGIWSLNYDRIIIHVDNVKIGARVGFGLMTEGYEGSTVDVFIPFTINGMYAIKNHHVEAGIGFNFASFDIRDVSDVYNPGWTRKTEFLGSWHLGYRFQKPDGGLFLKFVYTPFFYKNDPIGRYEHWGGLGIGWTLKAGKTGKKALIQ